MTSRLKRKLNDLGVDTSSNKANENFCLIGTPLPPLEKSKDTGEFVPLWKQDVRDEKGRRRLHGAFTGGWSAGYYNTVGSKEGWAPSTFISSRGDRAKKQQVRPEDFMDEEDLAELRDSRNLIDENEEMDFGGTEAELKRRAGVDTEDDSMAGALAAALAPTPQDSVGARILRKMGWRVGQGIGPRLTWEQRRAQDWAALGGTAQGVPEGEDEEAGKHMYPRRDTPLLLVARKDNSHGLGYSPGLGLQASVDAESSTKRKGPTLAAGFGLGALNDADEDDLDVYDGSVRPAGGRRVAYDATDDDETITMGSSRQAQRRTTNADRSTSVTQTFRDGRRVLKGFVLSDKPVSEDRWFPLPEIPPGWKPNPKRVWEADVANKENKTPVRSGVEPPKTHAEWKASLLSADERGTMLGETPLPSKPRSVFDFLSQKDKERIEKAKEAIQGRAAAGHPPEEPARPVHIPGELEIPELHPSIAKAALSGFQPFTADPVKQARYTSFLSYASSAASDRRLGLGPLPDQSVEEFNKELADYAKSATVFKPLSGAMASRFQSAAVVENGPKVYEGLHMPDLSASTDSGEDDEGATEEEEKKDADPRMAAVRVGMFGPLTREVTPWQPDRLLCKRFGVKPPEIETDETEGSVPATGTHQGAASEAGPSGSQPPLAITDGKTADADAADGERPAGPRNLANIGLGEDDEQGRDTLTYQRPGMDVFKAIFASDDEDSDDDEDKPPVVASAPAVETTATTAEDTPAEGGSSTPTFYMPADDAPAPAPSASENVDLATFKPTFVPRSERESRKDKDKKNGDHGKKDKEKKKKHAKTLVSFAADDGEEGLQVVPKREKHKDGERKKKKRKEKKEADDDDSMWVEAPAPEVLQHLPPPPPPAAVPNKTSDPPPPDTSTVAGPPRGRKRAIDFM